MMMPPKYSLTFKVSRKNPEVISPAKPTPHEIKFLSDIDDQDGLRLLVPLIYFYQKSTSMEGKDPVDIIRDAIAKALVFYYPLAGRLREYSDRKLVVECAGQGVVFVEADADVMLNQFGDALYPPFPNLEGLLLDMPMPPGSHGIINCPLLIIQVTRLRCGGFICAYRFNHTICDGAGIFQFLSTVGELARGGAVPSIPPVWERHLLTARRHRPNVPEYDAMTSGITGTPPINDDTMVQRSFLIGASDISALRHSLPPHLQSCSKFDVVAACVWRCRTIALAIAASRKPDEESRFLCVVDIRRRMNPPLPVGYYGNAIVFPAAVATVEKLTENPLHYAVEMVRKAKNEATNDYVASVVDVLAGRERPSFTPAMTYVVSDLTHAGFEQVDFGWGTAAYGGVANGVADWVPIHVNWYVPLKNKMGEEGIIVPACLPLNVMEEFVKHLEKAIFTARTSSCFNPSAL